MTLSTKEKLPSNDDEAFPQVSLATGQNDGLQDPRIVWPKTNVVVTNDDDSGDEAEVDDQSLANGKDDDEVIIQPGKARKQNIQDEVVDRGEDEDGK